MILPVASRPSYSPKAPEATSISSPEMPSGSVGRLWPSVLASIASSTGRQHAHLRLLGKAHQPRHLVHARGDAGLGQRRGAVLGHALAVGGAGEARGDLRRDVLDMGLGVGRRHRCDDALIRHAQPLTRIWQLRECALRHVRRQVRWGILRQTPGAVTSGRPHAEGDEANAAHARPGQRRPPLAIPSRCEIVRGALRAIQSEMEARDRAHGHVAVHPREEGLLRRAVRRRRPADRRLQPAGVRRRRRARRRALPARDHAPGRPLLVQRLLRLEGRRLAFPRPGVRRAGVRRRQARGLRAVAGRISTTSAACAPGSLSPDCTDIFQEGIIVPPVRLVREGVVADELLRMFFRNSRFPEMVQGRHARLHGRDPAGRAAPRRAVRALRPRRARRAPSTALIARDRAPSCARSCARSCPRAARLHRHHRQRRPGPRPDQAALSPRGRRPSASCSTPAPATTRCRGRSTS